MRILGLKASTVGAVTAAFLAVPAPGMGAAELLFPNSDFEAGTLAGWTQEGDAFLSQPTSGDNPRARGRESSGHEGQFWVGGFEKYDGRQGAPGDMSGDEAVGELVSPEFTIRRPYITFLVGGGCYPGETGVALQCDGQEFEMATGGDSETMSPASYDVARFLGKPARIQVFDRRRGAWGHVNVDSFRAADEPLPHSTRDLALDESIPQAPLGASDYREALRPQFHFTSRRNWLNDPNGMVYDGRQFHLFFQHNPLAPTWGNMTWGHATSPDMIHWTQQAHALRPYQVDRRYGTIYSGSALVDHNNSLGVQRGPQKTLCAFFTFAGRPRFYQAMAYSTDGGATWTYWNEGRPVVDNQGLDAEERDPKVFWHEPSRRWVMALWVQTKPGRIRFFTSQDLVHWEHASDLLRDWAFECIDLVFLPVDGDPRRRKAVLYDASFDYEIGTFDGRAFRTEHGPFLAGGGNFYAAQTFNGASDGRVVQIGWMRGGPNMASRYGLPCNQQMSFPCELTLRTRGGVPRLYAWPVREIESLAEGEMARRDVALGAEDNLLAGEKPLDLVDLQIEFRPSPTSKFRFQLAGAELEYDAGSGRLMHRGVRGDGEPVDVVALDDLRPREGVISLRLLVDRLSVEAFAFDGERFYAGYRTPQSDSHDALRVVSGDVHVRELTVRRLASAWVRK